MVSRSYYKVGGSLKANHPTYVFRKADQELLEKLVSKNYSCVFNSRQMGKSSLRIQFQVDVRSVSALMWGHGFILWLEGSRQKTDILRFG